MIFVFTGENHTRNLQGMYCMTFFLSDCDFPPFKVYHMETAAVLAGKDQTRILEHMHLHALVPSNLEIQQLQACSIITWK
jgi:hypothetical protein